jgi:FKBP-type peptidyl-prolyl cis-trans isomerase
MPRVRTWSIAVAAVSALALAGCSSSSSSTTSTSTTAPVPTATIPTADRSPAGKAGTQPAIVVPPGAAPTKLETADLIVGSGPKAEPGDKVTVQYVLATYSTGKEVQSSWTSQPFTFKLDATPEAVITGWDKGVVGMQAGGRRELIIPPSLGYGDQSPGAGVAANDTLVFIVDLLKIN